MLMHGYVSDHLAAAFDLYVSSLIFERTKDPLLQHFTSPHQHLNAAISNQPAQFTVYPHKQGPLPWLAKPGSRHCQLVWELQQESLTNYLQKAGLLLRWWTTLTQHNTNPWDQGAFVKYSQTSDAVLVSA